MSLCDSRTACRLCRLSSEFRTRHGLPEACPYGTTAPAPSKNKAGNLIPVLPLAERLAICSRCPLFSEGHCKKCKCPDSARRPAVELLECPIRRWKAD